MGTHAIISIEIKDGENDHYVSSYCHYDGMPSSMLPVLEEFYPTATAALGLIAPGGMSSVRCTTTWTHGEKRTAQPLYYHERGEYSPATVSDDFEEVLEEAEGTGAEHLYVFMHYTSEGKEQEGWLHHQPTA